MIEVKPALKAWVVRLSAELETTLKQGDVPFVTRLSREFFMVNEYDGRYPVDERGYARSFDPLPRTETPIAFGIVSDPTNVLVGEVGEGEYFQSTNGIAHDVSQILWWTYVQDASRIVTRHKAKQMEKQF